LNHPDNSSASSRLIEGRSAPSFNVGVLLERSEVTLSSGFTHRRWALAELVLRPESDSAQSGRCKTVVEHSEQRSCFMWTGFELAFYRDGGESYWHALVGEQQQVYVVCQEDEEDEMAPILVTADYDEAMAYQEADDLVLSCEMPAEIYQTLERFVLENYTPEQKRRRKRKQWHSQEQQDEPFARKPR